MNQCVVVLNLRNYLSAKARASLSAAASHWGAEYREITRPVVRGLHPFWQKAILHRTLPDHTHVLQLDADILVRKDAPSPFPLCPPGEIGLVRVNPHYCRWVGGRNQAIMHWADKLGLPPVDVHVDYPNLGFLLYSTDHHRDVLERVFEHGRAVRWAKDRMPEQTILAFLVKHERIPHRWLPTILNTCGIRHQSGISKQGPMSTFVYHFCGDSSSYLKRMDWNKIAPPVRAGEIYRRLPKDRPLRGVEVGVYRGSTASRLLCYLPRLTLVMVDAWSEVGPNSRYRKSGDKLAQRSQTSCDWDFEVAWRETEFAVERRRPIYQCSFDACRILRNEGAAGTFDFVFIDADHSYEGVKGDIERWTPMLKPGGLMCGHDYGSGQFPGVTRAVNEAFGTKATKGRDSTWFAQC